MKNPVPYHAYEKRGEIIERLKGQLDSAGEYACNLQRMIERHCRGELIDDALIKNSPHLGGKLNEHLRAIQADSAAGRQSD